MCSSSVRVSYEDVNTFTPLHPHFRTNPASLPPLFTTQYPFFCCCCFFGAAFSSSLLTVDCKCPNLGRQPFLITRITLLSDRKIKLNNSIAYSWSQTAALRTHQSPLKLFHAPPSTHTRIYTQAAIHRQYANANLLFDLCYSISSTFSLITECTTWRKKKEALFFFVTFMQYKKKRCLKWKIPLRVPVAYEAIKSCVNGIYFITVIKD